MLSREPLGISESSSLISVNFTYFEPWRYEYFIYVRLIYAKAIKLCYNIGISAIIGFLDKVVKFRDYPLQLMGFFFLFAGWLACFRKQDPYLNDIRQVLVIFVQGSSLRTVYKSLEDLPTSTQIFYPHLLMV